MKNEAALCISINSPRKTGPIQAALKRLISTAARLCSVSQQHGDLLLLFLLLSLPLSYLLLLPFSFSFYSFFLSLSLLPLLIFLFPFLSDLSISLFVSSFHFFFLFLLLPPLLRLLLVSFHLKKTCSDPLYGRQQGQFRWEVCFSGKHADRTKPRADGLHFLSNESHTETHIHTHAPHWSEQTLWEL